ncbi:MAG TPA: SDR family oxidoreductase [Candidatus Kryptonia bacterium]
MRLKDKVAIVTGASRGIGRGVALRFIEEGAKVVAVARNVALLDSLVVGVSGNGSRVKAIAADISKVKDCELVVSETMNLHGRVDVLVNAAGLLGNRVGLTSVSVAEWEEIFATNVTGSFLLSKLAAIEMLKQRRGSIINVTSGVVARPNPNWGPYLPSKFAVEGMTLMLAEELRDTGVRVNMVDPGRTRTDMIRKAYPDLDPNSLKEPSEVAESFVFLASDESRCVTGTRIRVA